jgi:hypothetical protein
LKNKKPFGEVEVQQKYIALNQKFMEEVERGASWKELRAIIDEMVELVKQLDHLEPAVIFSMHGYPRAHVQ